MPNPLMSTRRVTSKTNVDRPVSIEPAMEEYAGDNIPYRGIEQHGVIGKLDFREPDEDMPDADGRLVPVYEPPDPDPDPIPVRLVNSSSIERRAFRPVVSYATGSDNGSRARAILDRDDNRTAAVIYNRSEAVVWVGDMAESATAMAGFPIVGGGSYRTESQEPVYATVEQTADAALYIAVEYRKNLDV